MNEITDKFIILFKILNKTKLKESLIFKVSNCKITFYSDVNAFFLEFEKNIIVSIFVKCIKYEDKYKVIFGEYQNLGYLSYINMLNIDELNIIIEEFTLLYI
jgi:hypothetical protein